MLSVRWTGQGGLVSGRLKVAMVAILREILWVFRKDLFACGSLGKINDGVRDRSAMCSSCTCH